MNYLGGIKVFNHPMAYAQWFDYGDTGAPITIKIDLTNRCNHACPHCIDKGFRDGQDINTNAILQLLEDISKMGVKGVHITGGGEPLLHKDAHEIMIHAQSVGLEVGLITNGSLLKPMHSRSCDWIRVSLDASDKDEYAEYHGHAADWEKTIAGIKNVVGKTFVSLQTLNCDTPETFIKLAKSLGVNGVQISPLINQPIEIEKYRIDSWKAFSDEKFTVMVNEEKFNVKGRTYSTCEGQHFKSTNICADGNVYMCCQLAGARYARIGNIYQNTFQEIWNSEARKDVIDKIDVSLCPELCVCDSLNRLLHTIKNFKHKDSL